MPQPKIQTIMNTLFNIPKKTLLLCIFGLVFAAIVLTIGFIWPTPYNYRDLRMGFLGNQTIRTNRITGNSFICGDGRWQSIEIKGDNITIPGGTTLSVGVSCSHTPSAITICLILIGIIEILLIVLLIRPMRPTKLVADAPVITHKSTAQKERDIEK
jgi:hypothetical protein